MEDSDVMAASPLDPLVLLYIICKCSNLEQFFILKSEIENDNYFLDYVEIFIIILVTITIVMAVTVIAISITIIKNCFFS